MISHLFYHSKRQEAQFQGQHSASYCTCQSYAEATEVSLSLKGKKADTLPFPDRLLPSSPLAVQFKACLKNGSFLAFCTCKHGIAEFYAIFKLVAAFLGGPHRVLASHAVIEVKCLISL